MSAFDDVIGSMGGDYLGMGQMNATFEQQAYMNRMMQQASAQDYPRYVMPFNPRWFAESEYRQSAHSPEELAKSARAADQASWERGFRQEQEAYAADQKRTARRRTRIAAYILGGIEVAFLIQAVLAYFSAWF